jgi:hypothetical protein
MRSSSSPSRQRGVAILEFALILPILIILLFMVTEFGRALMNYDAVTKSVRQAARYLSIQAPGTKLTEARNLVVYGNTAGSGSPIVPGLSLTNVPDPTWDATGSLPEINVVTVTVTGYIFTPLITTAFGLDFGPITFNDISAKMRSAL